MKTYTKFLLKLFLISFSYVLFIISCLVIILNVLSEIEFYKSYNVDHFLPIYMALLNAPALIFEIFPFIFLISTQLFFVSLFNNNEIEIFKYSGLKNTSILKVLSSFTLIIGIFSSVFSAVVISRLIFTWMMNKKQSISFSSKITENAFKNVNFNFVGKRRLAYIISGTLVLISLILIFTKGINQSVEFSGGRTIPVTFEKSASNQIENIKGNLSKTMPGASIEVKTKSSSNVVEITTNYLLSDPEGEAKVNKALVDGLNLSKDELGNAKIDFENDRYVSSNVASQIKSSAVVSMTISLLIIFLYIFIRFGTWQYSLSAIIALFHDVIITLGIFALFNGILPFNMDLDQALVAAFLTVVGYSINDTVVVFDRIRENLSWKKDTDYKGEINGALNSTLSRTLNTSFTTLLVLFIIFIFGGTAIKGFIFALLLGILVGTYSSIFIATPLLIDFSKKIVIKK